MTKIIRLLALMLVANGCANNKIFASENSCLTACGMRMYGSKDCAGFQKAENRAIEVYDHYLNSTSTCNKLFGWTVHVKYKIWLSPEGWPIYGLTSCEQKISEINTDNWPSSSLSHELLHAVECNSFTNIEDPHIRWKKGWQYEAIYKAL